MADFNNIQTPDFARAALGGYAAGQAMGKAKRRDEALALYGRDPNAGIEALNGVDPALAEQLRANAEAREVKKVYAEVYTPQPALGPAPMPAQAPPALGAPPPQLVPSAAPRPTAGGLQINMEALQRLASLGPEGAAGAQKIYALMESGTKQQQEAFKAHAEMRGQLAMYLKTLPMERRAEAYQAALPELQARGFIPQAVQGMQFDDAILDRDIAFAVPTVQALTQAREDRKERMSAADRAADNARADAGLGLREEALRLAKSRAAGGGAATPDFSTMSDAAIMAIITGQN